MTIAETTPSAPVHIVLVEDDPDLRGLFVDLLAAEGREIHAFDNAERALELVLRAPCPLVITDFRLPGMTGLELADGVHAHNADTWVVIASGAELPRLGSSPRRLRYMMKPFSIEEMLELVEQLSAPKA